MFKSIGLAVEIITFSGFTWAALFFFENAKSPKLGVRMIKIFGTCTIVIDLYNLMKKPSLSRELFLTGSFLFMISHLLFWTAIYVNRKKPLDFAFAGEPKSFVSQGPYRLIRHPIYGSYLTAWAGAFAWSPCFSTALMFFVMLVLYQKAIEKEEGDFLNSPFRERYLRYMQGTLRYFPRLTRERRNDDTADTQKAA